MVQDRSRRSLAYGFWPSQRAPSGAKFVADTCNSGSGGFRPLWSLRLPAWPPRCRRCRHASSVCSRNWTIIQCPSPALVVFTPSSSSCIMVRLILHITRALQPLLRSVLQLLILLFTLHSCSYLTPSRDHSHCCPFKVNFHTLPHTPTICLSLLFSTSSQGRSRTLSRL